MGRFLKVLFIIIGIIFIIWFAIPIVVKGIVNIGNITGIILGVLFLLYGIFFHWVNETVVYLWGKYLAAKIIEIIIGLALLAILCLAVLCMIAMGTASGKPTTPNATAIVLGCKVNAGGVPSLMLETRLEAAKEYLENNPESKAIVSGGQGKDETETEASAMYNWLTSHGISADRIIMEDESTDTHENLENCKEIIYSMDSDSLTMNVVLVTNEFHQYRSLKIAEEKGFTASPCVAHTPWWLFPTYYVREMYGILEDWFLL